MIGYFKSTLYKFYQLFVMAGSKPKRYFYGNEKSFMRKLFDHFIWLFYDKQANGNYYAFGLNIKGRSQKEYIGRKEFLSLKIQAETKIKQRNGSEMLSYDVLTKDKFVNFAYLKSLNIPVVPVKKLVADQIIGFEGESHQLNELFHHHSSFVLKNITLEYGEGFLLCYPVDANRMIVNDKPFSFNELQQLLKGRIWIMQDLITAHDAIRKINDTALNTTRIVTVMNGAMPAYLTGFQSFATGDNKIDSWGKGAVYVGINPDKNCLKSPGFYHPAIPSKSITGSHPDSGIHFDDYPIPFLGEAVELCLRGHGFLYNHFVIGWDIVITDDGPLVLEANERPGMNAVQCLDGGLRAAIHRTFQNTLFHLSQ